MLTIYEPEIIISPTGVRLQAEFKIKNKLDILWYEVDKKHSKYLTIERLDAFLVGLLPKAIQKGCDITVNYSLSERLYYTLNNYFIPVISDSLNCKPIKVYCAHLTSDLVKSDHGVGTGLSCGVDSFSTIYEHLKDDCPKGYQITHFTYFNVGSHGSFGGEKSRHLFAKRLEHVKECAEELGKELVVIDSNISELLQMNFAKLHTIRNISAVLAMQKLFKVYYYSSSVHIKDFTLEKSIGSYDTFSLNMLTTENVNLISSCATTTRLDKTRMITDFKPVQKYLNVCISDGQNCGKCVKCARTLFTLELFGEVDKFSAIFNIKEYQKRRSRYIVSVIARHRFNNYKKEIYQEIKRLKFRIPFHLKIIGFIVYVKIRSSMVFQEVNNG